MAKSTAPHRILLLGSAGQVGREARRALAVLGEVHGVSRAQCDLAQLPQVRTLVREFAPTIIINAAAWTAVDAAEQNEAGAMQLNAALPELLAEEAARSSAWLVHYSSDYVFDGTHTDAYRETDRPAPLNAYGRSKLAGEQAVAQLAPHHLILRTSWVFGLHGQNFLKAILRKACIQDWLEVVDDQHGAPTSAALVADVTAHALATLLRGAGTPGLYHLASSGTTHWCDYARLILAEAERLGAPLQCRPAQVRAMATPVCPGSARRPANSCLDTQKLRTTFGLVLPGWQTQVRQVLQALLMRAL